MLKRARHSSTIDEGRAVFRLNFCLLPSLSGHEDDGAAAVRGGEQCAAVADLADDLALLVDELELAEVREAVEVYVARARRDGRQAEARLGRDAELYVALRRVEYVSPAAKQLR